MLNALDSWVIRPPPQSRKRGRPEKKKRSKGGRPKKKKNKIQIKIDPKETVEKDVVSLPAVKKKRMFFGNKTEKGNIMKKILHEYKRDKHNYTSLRRLVVT